MDQAIPGFAPDTRLKLAKQIVERVRAIVARRRPVRQDQFQQEADKLNTVLRAPPPSLLQQAPVGVSVSIHFDSIFSGRR